MIYLSILPQNLFRAVKGRNKHHYEYWIDYGTGVERGMQGMKIPNRYMVEMICDRIAAAKNYNGSNYTDASPWEYYERGREYAILHKESRELLEKLLLMLKEQGEKKTFAYIRENIDYTK